MKDERMDGHRKIDEVTKKKSNYSASKGVLSSIECIPKKNTVTAGITPFLAHISHEVKTPLTAMKGFLDLALKNSDSKRNQIYLKVIQRNNEQLLFLLSNLLDYAKIESNQLDIDCFSFSLFEEIEKVIAAVSPLAEAKGLSLEIRYIGLLPKTVFSDSHKLKQILINMLDNAIKFTKKGTVSLIVKVELSEDSNSDSDSGIWQLHARIIDSGDGISSESVTRLFAPSTEYKNCEDMADSGLGIGLALSQSLARRLGGDVRLQESIVGVGSTFDVNISLGELEEVPFFNPSVLKSKQNRTALLDRTYGDPFNFSPLDGVNILVAEDSLDIQTLISLLITQLGGAVVVCDDGQQALDALQTEPFDLVLMDLQMPVMNGYESLKQMRELGFEKPIVAFTAHALKHEKEHCKEVGFNGVLPKPFDQKRLLEEIFTHLEPLEKVGFSDPNQQLDPGLKEAYDMFHSNTPKLIEELLPLNDKSEIKKVAQIAHKIKGSSSCFGYKKVASVASELYSRCTDKAGTVEEIILLIKKLKKEYNISHFRYRTMSLQQ